jgi:hypothetical protein
MLRKVLPIFEVKTFADYSFNSRVFAEMRRSFVGWDDGRGLSVCDRKNCL